MKTEIPNIPNVLTFNPPSQIREGYTFCILSQSCGYPESEMFQPREIIPSKFLAKQLYSGFKSAINREFAPTREDAKRCEGVWKCALSNQTPRDASSHDIDSNDWVRDGIHWRRIREGRNPHCWTMSRVGSVCTFRDHENSYGYNCGQSEAFRDKLAMRTETVKPVVFAILKGHKIQLSIDREITPPHGNIWGYTTGNVFWRFDVDGIPPFAIRRMWVHLDRTLRYLVNEIENA